MNDYRGYIVMTGPSYMGQYLVINPLSSLSTPISDITNDDNFASMLENKVQVSAIQSGSVNFKQGKAVEALALVKPWMISPNQSNNTVRKTTQRVIIMVMNPHMSQQYPTNDQMLRYPHLPNPVITDTMISGTISKHVNNNSQVCGTSFGWTRLLPMKITSDAYETFPLLFKRDGVPY